MSDKQKNSPRSSNSSPSTGRQPVSKKTTSSMPIELDDSMFTEDVLTAFENIQLLKIEDNFRFYHTYKSFSKVYYTFCFNNLKDLQNTKDPQKLITDEYIAFIQDLKENPDKRQKRVRFEHKWNYIIPMDDSKMPDYMWKTIFGITKSSSFIYNIKDTNELNLLLTVHDPADPIFQNYLTCLTRSYRTYVELKFLKRRRRQYKDFTNIRFSTIVKDFTSHTSKDRDPITKDFLDYAEKQLFIDDSYALTAFIKLNNALIKSNPDVSYFQQELGLWMYIRSKCRLQKQSKIEVDSEVDDN